MKTFNTFWSDDKISLVGINETCYNLKKVVEDLHTTDDREAREESHGPPHCPQHVPELDPLVPGDPVEHGRPEVNPHKLKFCFKLKSWK